MHSKITKWGNSASVRIPAPLLKAANLNVDDDVELREEEGRIIIQAAQKSNYTLDQLLAGITPDNIHNEVDFGPAVGKELL